MELFPTPGTAVNPSSNAPTPKEAKQANPSPADLVRGSTQTFATARLGIPTAAQFTPSPEYVSHQGQLRMPIHRGDQPSPADQMDANIPIVVMLIPEILSQLSPMIAMLMGLSSARMVDQFVSSAMGFPSTGTLALVEFTWFPLTFVICVSRHKIVQYFHFTITITVLDFEKWDVPM